MNYDSIIYKTKNEMKIEKVYKFQLFLYAFIIFFGIQNYCLNKYVFNWSFYEYILIIVFILSIVTFLFSLIVLTYESIKTLNRKEINANEKSYLITNLILYYFVQILNKMLHKENYLQQMVGKIFTI